MVTPAAEQKAVAHLRASFEMSERRACKAIGCCRMTMRYKTTRADDAGLRQRMKAIATNAAASAIGACMSCSSGKVGRYVIKPQEAVPALSGREACGTPPWRPQAPAAFVQIFVCAVMHLDDGVLAMVVAQTAAQARSFKLGEPNCNC
jgi:hypothetical protein